MPHAMISGRQIKAARALLGWSRKDLAEGAGVSEATVKVVEKDMGFLEALAATRARMSQVLGAAGIAFTNGGSIGVYLQPRDEGLRPEDLNASNDD